MSSPPRLVLITGVAGSGKTTVGRGVAAILGWPYFEADDFHPPENKSKMARGLPLDESDRAPWLAAIRAQMNVCRADGASAVFTCSALKAKYRAGLGGADVVLVYLAGDYETILARVRQREGHYMKAEMVRSQFEALEPPADALTLDATLEPGQIINAILAYLGHGPIQSSQPGGEIRS